MNELMIVLDCEPARWIYFKTHEKDVKEAVGDYESVCELSGINMDNAPFRTAELRDSNGNTLGVWRKGVWAP